MFGTLSIDQVEDTRLEVFARLELLDMSVERDLEILARIAATSLGVQGAAITLVDQERQWSKASHGIGFFESPRETAFCADVVASGELLVVPDAAADQRFRGNLLARKRGIRFYAGAPLTIGGLHCVGTLCVLDSSAREGLTTAQTAILTDLAKVASNLLETHQLRRRSKIAAKVVEATPDAIVAADQTGTIVYWNAAAERMFGRPAHAALGHNIEIIIPTPLAGHQESYARAAAGGSTRLVGSSLELVAMRSDGSEFPVELSLERWGDAAPDCGFAAIIRDITNRHTLEKEREQARSFLNCVIENLPAMLFVKDAQTRRYVMVNRRGEDLIGKPAAEIIGGTDRELFPQYATGYEQRDTAAMTSGQPHVFESGFRRDDGRAVHLRTTRLLIDGPDKPEQYILGVCEDVTEVRNAEAEIRRLAHFDAATGLLNRASYTDRLARLLESKAPFAMLSVDLDRFKAVNDQFGHPVGDEVLAQAGERLRNSVGPSDWIARTGGDEFIVMLLGGDLRERAQAIGPSIVEKLRAPFATEHAVAYTGASIGAVFFPEDGATHEQIRANADLALYRAKQQGGGDTCFFNAEMDLAAHDKRRLERDLREAISNGNIELCYQPILEVRSGRISSFEALARWTHPERGPVRPDVFISLAEECGLINNLGQQLLKQACNDALTLPENIRVAVNLSPLQFIAGDLVETVRRALEETELRPSRLQIEVTEGLVIRDVERTFKQLEQLRELGIQILMDDFGVGYSSLSYFERFPFDKVKIDKTFVAGVAASRASKAIIQAVVGLGKELGMGIVAEGIETEEQVEMLVACGCTHLQGYLVGAPASIETSRAMLKLQGRSSYPAQ